ncbi:MAG: DNA helicase HerA-like ATPase [Planctomycetota bacterium]|jgi:DNA helicase HerA-like ATPase
MIEDGKIFVGGGGENYADAQSLLTKYANRHGLIAGATGTGKTVTLQVLAESFSELGVPIFLTDVKGDLSGLAKAGSPTFKLHDAFTERAQKIKFDSYKYAEYPVVFWDLHGVQGHPIRTTVADLGPLLLSRMLELSEAQEGIINIAFRVSDEEGWPLLDLKDLRAMLTWVAENARDLTMRYGYVQIGSVATIQRRLLVLENEGGAQLFGEPALDLSDMFVKSDVGKGRINILAADKLMQAPRLYATFLLWLLSELFETLPELGNPEKPELVLFFDEAHLLFEGSPKALMDKIEQVARLIRSKGVAVFFITQKPADVPVDILGQLGNRIQHALRAFTGRDIRMLNAAAESYRANPDFDTREAIKNVGVGEAVTSFLERKGIPSVVQRTLIRPPSSQLGPISTQERAAVIAASPIAGKYEAVLDRDSAYEILLRRAEKAALDAAAAEAGEEGMSIAEREVSTSRRYTGSKVSRSTSKRRTDSIGQTFAKSLARTLGNRAGNAIVRGVLGSIFKGL